jgi:hypothetical protein
MDLATDGRSFKDGCSSILQLITELEPPHPVPISALDCMTPVRAKGEFYISDDDLQSKK